MDVVCCPLPAIILSRVCEMVEFLKRVCRNLPLYGAHSSHVQNKTRKLKNRMVLGAFSTSETSSHGAASAYVCCTLPAPMSSLALASPTSPAAPELPRQDLAQHVV